MKNATWEMSFLDWSKTGADGNPVSPGEVSDLLFADDPRKARKAFFLVIEAVGQNGEIYACALTVARTILASLPQCGIIARFECLDLIAQIVSSESEPNSPGVAEECALEIRNAFWYFVYGLQFDDVKLAGFYVDILGCLALRFPELKVVVKRYLNLVLGRDLLEVDFAMVRNTIADLPL